MSEIFKAKSLKQEKKRKSTIPFVYTSPLSTALISLEELRTKRKALGEFDANAGTIIAILDILDIMLRSHLTTNKSVNAIRQEMVKEK